jgi:hypothetical protein
VDSGFIDITAPHTSEAFPTSPRLSPHKRIKSVLKILREGRISVLDFLLSILDPSEIEFSFNRDRIYNYPAKEKGNSTGKLEQLLDCMFADSRGRARMLKWFRPHAVDYVSDVVSTEMDAVKEDLRGALDIITLEFLLTWNLNSMMDNTVGPKAPVLRRLLHSAAQTARAKEKNKIKDCSTV